MGSFVLTDAVVTINAVDLSTSITSVTLSLEVDEQENTAFGGNGFRSRLAGLRDWSIDIDFNADFAAGAVDDTIWPLVSAGNGSVAVTVKADSAATGATNPIFSGNVLVTEYSPIDGGVGDLSTTSVSWPGNGPLVRAES